MRSAIASSGRGKKQRPGALGGVAFIGGSLAAYATRNPSPVIPVWPLAFKNIRVFFLGSDDFPAEVKAAAADGLNAALEAVWPGFEIDRRFPLSAIAEAHEYVEGRRGSGRVVVMLSGRTPST